VTPVDYPLLFGLACRGRGGTLALRQRPAESKRQGRCPCCSARRRARLGVDAVDKDKGKALNATGQLVEAVERRDKAHWTRLLSRASRVWMDKPDIVEQAVKRGAK